MDYKSLLSKLEIYKKKYKVTSLGKSQFNRDIFAVEKSSGVGLSTAFLIAGMHAREHITVDLVCKMLDDGLFDDIQEFNICIIVMSNPDGIELCTGGVLTAPEKFRKTILGINLDSQDFSLWKANGLGVDLNNNFDAKFGTNIGSTIPSSQGFAGWFAESAKETKLIADYTRSIKPFITISFHSKGEEIYYNFFQSGFELQRDKLIAERFAASTGYEIKNPEMISSGGYKDWCISELKIPSLTIEVGNDNLIHPISVNHLSEIYEHHKFIAKDLKFAYNIVRDKNNV